MNVALPSIRADLGFSETSLAWVVNAYMLTFGGFLLLGGRLGDLFGHRRMFLIGIASFTAASLVCGLSDSQGMLVVARAVQGLGGAVVSAVALSLIMVLFTEPAERAKAMGVFGFVGRRRRQHRRAARWRPHRRARAGTGSSWSTSRSASPCSSLALPLLPAPTARATGHASTSPAP